MINLPLSDKLSINRLACIFNDTTNSYKFFWFLALLDELQGKNTFRISFNSLGLRMLSNVLFPLEFYKLSFGKQDGFVNIANYLNDKIVIDFTPTGKPIENQLNTNLNEEEKAILFVKINMLTRWVPYRLIRPFFSEETRALPDSKVNETIRQLANNSYLKNPVRCLYYFDNDGIIINDYWVDYLKENYSILKGYTYWHLIQYLQKNNPNVIGISKKLVKPSIRKLKLNIDSWKHYLLNHPYSECIYSHTIIPNSFTLDHFVPWSYVVHDLSWNLIPVSKCINSKKNNRLPCLNDYLIPFLNLQADYFRFLIDFCDYAKILEDYCLLFEAGIRELKLISPNSFRDKLAATITPLIQIAGNAGFEMDWKYI